VVPFIIAGIIMMTGYVSILILFSSAIRDETPVDHVGMFQGIRLLAYVLVPMIIGPMIGSGLINGFSHQTYVNSYGETVLLPVGVLFIASAIAGLLLYLFAFCFPKQKKKAAGAAHKAQ
jgi:MFS family permease